MKAVIVDPALRSMGGHHYNATLGLKAQLSAQGIDHSCLGSAFADAKVAADLGCTPTFTRSVYGRAYQDPEEFERDVRATARELFRALRGHQAAPDLLILPCCDQVLALAIARYVRRAWFRRPPHVVLWLLFGPHYRKANDDLVPESLRVESREAFTALQRAVGRDNIMAYCETAGMAQMYHDLTGFSIGVASSPGLISDVDCTPQSSLSVAPTVTCIGFANEAKGYRLLPGAIERVLADNNVVQFMIHGVFRGSDSEEAGARIFDRLGRLGPRVTVRTEVLSQPDYRSWLREADLLLLPYDPEVYKTRGSGVFTEAHRAGIPVVVTKGCDFARSAFDKRWGVAVTDYDEAGVARAVLQALARIDEMTACARSAATTSDDATETILYSALATIRASEQEAIGQRVRRFFALG